uniref:SSD domain-containing protein n=1 Tax=Rhabditophanes sp. KR3021 TaxID=114890 RepID=A0AC35TVG6_9BILA
MEMTDRFVSTSVWKLENGISDQKPAWKQGPGEALSCRKQPDPSPPSSAKSQSTKDEVPSVTLKSYTTKDTDSYHDSSCSNSLKYKSMEKNLNFSSELSNPKIEALYSDCEVGEKEERSGGISKKELNGLVRKGGEVGLPALPINLAESGFGYKYGFGEGGVGGGSVVESSSGKPFRWAEIGVKRLLFFLGKNVPNYQLIFLIIPILLAMLSLFGPIYYYKNISYSVPFPAFMNPNEKSSNSEHYKIGSSSLQNFNSTNAMFGSIKKTLQSEFSVIMSMPNHYDNVINEDVVGYYQELRSTLQSLKFTRAKETKFKWADVCKEDCGEKNALIEKLIDKEMLLRYPEGVMKESFNQSINISKHFIGNILGDIVQDSEGIVSRARSLQLMMKMKDNLKNEIFEEYEKNFRIQMKFEAVAAESQGLELTFWSVRKYVDEVLEVIQAIHKNILYCAILLVVLCFIGGMKGDGYQSRPFFGIQIAVVILIAIICGVFVHIAGASQYYSFAFIVAFPIIQISILYFFSMMDTWSRYSMAALHPIEKLVFIVSWDGPAMVISFFIFVIATLVAAVFATNHHLQYSMIIGGGSFATLMTFSLSFLMVCMYRSGKAESSGIKWYHFCKNGDQNFNEKTLPDFDVNFFNILHEKLTDYRSTLSRKVGTFIANTNIRFLIVFTFAIYIVVGFFFAYQGTVNLKEEHFVSSNTTSAKYLAAYQNGFKKSDNFLEINFNAPLDYYDRVKKDEILSLLRWPLEQQYATKAISWLMDFDRFQHSTIYDVNADTIVPVVTLIFLKSPQFSRYSSDIVLDKFGTQIVKTRMYLELSTKGFSDQLSMIRGIKDLAKKYDLPITLKTPFIFSLDHDLQLFNCCLQAVLAICAVIVVLSLILFNNPAMSTIILVCNFIFVVIGVGYSHLCAIPLNIVTATGIIFGMIFNSAVSIHFSYNYSNSGSSQ